MANTRSGQTNSSNPRRREAVGGHMLPPQADQNIAQPPPPSPPQVTGRYPDISGNTQNLSGAPTDLQAVTVVSKLLKALPERPRNLKEDVLDAALWVRKSISWAQSMGVSCATFVHVLLLAHIGKSTEPLTHWFAAQQRAHTNDPEWDPWWSISNKLMILFNGKGYQGRLFLKYATLKQGEDEGIVEFFDKFQEAYNAAYPTRPILDIYITDIMARLNPYALSFLQAYLHERQYPTTPNIHELFEELENFADAIQAKTYANGFEPKQKTSNDPCPVVAQVYHGNKRQYDTHRGSPRDKEKAYSTKGRVGYFHHRQNGCTPQTSHRFHTGRGRGQGRSRGRGNRGQHPLGRRHNQWRDPERPKAHNPIQSRSVPQGYGFPSTYVQQVAQPMQPPSPIQQPSPPQMPQGYYQNF